MGIKKTESIDVLDAVGSNIRVDTYGWEVKRILPRLNEEINEEWISDKSRYSCDGLLKQRLDTPYIKKDNKLVKCSWDEAIQAIQKKIASLDPSQIAGHIGDMVSLENIFAFKKLFEIIKSENLEFREKNFYINNKDRNNYIFNSTIQGLEEADLILLVGCNPRHEATMINARIRKAFVKNQVPIFSIGNPGDLTYDYEIIGESTKNLNEIFKNQGNFSEKFNLSKKPIIIIGESVLELRSGGYIFEEFKEFLFKKNLINENWNALNILWQNASTVGCIDLNLISSKKEKSDFFINLKNNKFKFLYLLASDNIEINKKDEFIVYQGSHGDRGAEIADIILPSPSYTEQNGLYINVEGRVQECNKASFPVGETKDDWKIFNLISKILFKKNLFENFEYIRKEVLKNIPNFSEIGLLPNKPILKLDKKVFEFVEEKIEIKKIDYYFSNSISRSSKTMSDCRNIRSEILKNGTNN